MKKFATLFTAAVLSASAIAQVQSVLPVSTTGSGALTATAYDWQAIGVNPANLGWSENHNFAFSILNIGAAGQSEAMNMSTLVTALTSTNPVTSATDWQKIMGTPNGLNLTSDVNWAAVSFRLPHFPGTIAMNISDKVMANGYLGPNAAKALSNTSTDNINDSTMLGMLQGTTLHLMHYREINVDYGSPIVNVSAGSNGEDPDLAKCFSFSKGGSNGNSYDKLALYGGIGFKYLIGLANVNGNVNNGINTTYSMMNNYPNISSPIPGNAPGHGVAFDLGLGAAYKRWKFSISLTDMGSITWKRTYTTTGDTNVVTIRHGSDLINQFQNGTLEGSSQTFNAVTDLPAKMRMGASYRLTNRILLSSDVIISMINTVDNIKEPYFALGAEARIYKQISVCAGVNTTGFANSNIPVGLSMGTGKHFDFYIGTADITSYGKPNNANISAAMGLMRFTF